MDEMITVRRADLEAVLAMIERPLSQINVPIVEWLNQPENHGALYAVGSLRKAHGRPLGTPC